MTEFIYIVNNIFRGTAEFFGIKLIPAILIPVFGAFFGFDNLIILRALLFLIAFDFVTGVVSAHKNGEPIKSKGIVRTAFKVAVYGILVSSGYLTEQVTPGTWHIQDAVIVFLALTELISIIENVGRMGYAIPKKLLMRLQNLRDEETYIKEKITTKETTDPVTNITQKHTIQETNVETHISEKPNMSQ